MADSVQFARSGAWPVSLRRLASLGPLTSVDHLLVKQLKPQTLAANSVLTQPQDGHSPSWILLSGWCARVRPVSNSERHIVHFMLPGDMVGVGQARWAGDRLPVLALTPAIVADARALNAIVRLGSREHTGLVEACERAAWREQVYCLNAMTRLGQQSAYQRIAHLLLELHARLESVGLASSNGFQAPVTQAVLAQALGLSLVHLSRTLRQMRREGAIAFEPGRIEILRPDTFLDAVGFSHGADWLDEAVDIAALSRLTAEIK
ncbi:MAG TPA: Crp/Fnr family transcriptional regulator [Hyphomonadaceae bacterium]|nr:Crp/Fnr family transcriptional regulator [Hyphomonadaceae bacterium]